MKGKSLQKWLSSPQQVKECLPPSKTSMSAAWSLKVCCVPQQREAEVANQPTWEQRDHPELCSIIYQGDSRKASSGEMPFVMFQGHHWPLPAIRMEGVHGSRAQRPLEGMQCLPHLDYSRGTRVMVNLCHVDPWVSGNKQHR